jgi:hypothetical protein
MSRKSQRFLVTLWTEERAPSDIAVAVIEADLIDPEVETVHVLAYGENDFVCQPGSTQMWSVPGANSAAPIWTGFRIGDGPSTVILDSGGLQQP